LQKHGAYDLGTWKEIGLRGSKKEGRGGVDGRRYPLPSDLITIPSLITHKETAGSIPETSTLQRITVEERPRSQTPYLIFFSSSSNSCDVTCCEYVLGISQVQFKIRIGIKEGFMILCKIYVCVLPIQT
jgi:hypothetical protein